jgi:hypothetical protein
MRRSTVLLSVALVASVAAAAWSWSELRAARVRNAELGAELERALAAARSDSESSMTAPAPSAAPPAAEAAAAAPAAATSSNALVVQGKQEDWEAHQRQLMRDPKYREALREGKRLAYAPRRANLIRLLGLEPAQTDAAIDLQLEQEAQLNEAYQAESTTDETRMERRARIEALEQAHQDKLRELLGEEKRARLQTYMESRQSRMQVDSLRSELTEANTLRDDQVEPLIATLHVERAQMQSALQEYSDTLSWEGDATDSWRRYSERQGQLMKAMNAHMHSSASTILTGAQLDALDGQLGREFARFEARQRMNRIQSKLERANVPATPSN